MRGDENEGLAATPLICDGQGVNPFSAQVQLWLDHDEEWTAYKLAQKMVEAAQADGEKPPRAASMQNSLRRWAKDEHEPGPRNQRRILAALALLTGREMPPQVFWSGPPATAVLPARASAAASLGTGGRPSEDEKTARAREGLGGLAASAEGERKRGGTRTVGGQGS